MMIDKFGREIQEGDIVVTCHHAGRRLSKGTVAEVAPFAVRIVWDVPELIDANKFSRVLSNTSEIAIVGRDCE